MGTSALAPPVQRRGWSRPPLRAPTGPPPAPLRLMPEGPGSRLFTLEQRRRLKGTHSRLQQPAPGKVYVAGVALPDRPRESESLLSMRRPVTITIAELNGDAQAAIRIVQHLRWASEPGQALAQRLREALLGIWGCRKILVEGTAQPLMGQAPSTSSGQVLEALAVAPPRGVLGLRLMASLDAGRAAMYADDGSPEHREFWAQMVRARCQRNEGQGLTFSVEPSAGDDGFLVGLALVVHAAQLEAMASLDC